MTAALIIAVTAFLVPRFAGGDSDNARRTLTAALDAATQLRDQEQGWSADTSALGARTARVHWSTDSSASDSEVSVGVFGATGEVLAMASWNGADECWMVRADDSSGVPEPVWAVELMESSAGCTAGRADTAARIDGDAPGRGRDANSPLELD